jgi:protein-tyrosine kinase
MNLKQQPINQEHASQDTASQEGGNDVLDSIDSELRDALVAHCGVSEEGVERANEVVASQRMSFPRALQHLGLVTVDDIERVSSWIHQRSSNKRETFIETAIRSAQGGSTRALAVHEGPPAHPSAKLLHARDGDSERAEKIRALRTDLMLLSESSSRGNVFALLSPRRGEGRSQVCAELAMAFAQLGRRTLLIDADLRHPSQHVLFNVENQWGLAQTLAGGDQPNIYRVDGLPEMALLPSGMIPPNPLELVAHSRFQRFIQTLRQKYDFIVIDTPPVSQYADALQIAAVAQRVLAIGRSETTSLPSMKDMLRRLAVTDAKILGAVINKF